MYNVIWQNLVLLLLVNIIIDVTYLISGIYTDFSTFLCKNCDVGYYVYQSRNEIGDSRLVFIVSISLLRNVLNACQN